MYIKVSIRRSRLLTTMPKKTQKSRFSTARAKAPKKTPSAIPSHSSSAVPSRSVSVAPNHVISNAPSRAVSNAPSCIVSNAASRAASPDAQIDDQDANSEGDEDSDDPEAKLGVFSCVSLDQS